MSEKILSATLKGSFVSEDKSDLVRDKVILTAVKDDGNITTQTWKAGLIPWEVRDMFFLEQKTVKHTFDLQVIFRAASLFLHGTFNSIRFQLLFQECLFRGLFFRICD